MAATRLHIACLCAAWCRLCDSYAAVLREVVDEVSASTPGLQVHWIDIEDEAELVGEVDVETFPTLVLVEPGGALRFAGPLTPQADTLKRLLRSVLEDLAAPPVAADGALQAFARRLLARPLPAP